MFKHKLTLMLVTILILVFCKPDEGFSQSKTHSISGYVIDAETGETMISATVYLKGTKLGGFTNKLGFFSIKNIPSGKSTVVISMVGYKKKEVEINFGKDNTTGLKFKIEPSSVMSKEISVEAEREVEKRQITISKVNVPVKQIKEIRIGGESDVFRSLQLLPGVLTSSQISSGLFVRGGSPDQNLVLLDGTTVYNPTHLFGFISTFNSDAVKDVDLIKGGFPAEYGGRLSAVLNVTQKDGNREEVHGNAGIGLISSRLALEGPSPLDNGSWFIGGRRSYFDVVKSFIDDPENPLPDFNFYDMNAKFVQDLSRDDKFFFSGFLSEDDFGFGDDGIDMNLSIQNQVGSLRWTHIFDDDLFSTVNFSASNYKNYFFVDNSGYQIEIGNRITDYTLKTSIEWFNSEKLTTKFGFEGSRYTFDFDQNFSGDTDTTIQNEGGVDIKVHDWNYALYGQMNYQATDDVSLQAGLRGSYWNMKDVLLADPRLAARWQFRDDMAVKVAWGIFHQNLRLASLQDFSFFDTWLPTDSTVPVSSAQHFILSLETNPIQDYELNFDFYYKDLKNISEVKEISTGGENVADAFFIGDGYAYGAEFFLQKKIGNFTGWLGYAIGWVNAKFDSINHGKEFNPKYDRRHDFKIVVQWKIDDSWDVGANFIFQTGQSYTGAESRFQTRFPGTNYGRGKIVPSQRYGLRLPPSHQLNLNASYSFETFGLPSRVILDIYNAYNHDEIFFRYYDTTEEETTVEDVTLLPILPTFSYEITF